MINIKINSVLSLKKILGGEGIDLSVPEGSTIRDILFLIVKKWGDEVSPHIFKTGSDSLLPHLRLMVNGRSIEFLNGMETILQDGDEFLILPLLTGG